MSFITCHPERSEHTVIPSDARDLLFDLRAVSSRNRRVSSRIRTLSSRKPQSGIVRREDLLPIKLQQFCTADWGGLG